MLAVAWLKKVGKCGYWQRNQVIGIVASVFPAEPGKEKLGWKILWQGFNYNCNVEACSDLLLPAQWLPASAALPGWLRALGCSVMADDSSLISGASVSTQVPDIWKSVLANFGALIWEQVLGLRQSICCSLWLRLSLLWALRSAIWSCGRVNNTMRILLSTDCSWNVPQISGNRLTLEFQQADASSSLCSCGWAWNWWRAGQPWGPQPSRVWPNHCFIAIPDIRRSAERKQ